MYRPILLFLLLLLLATTPACTSPPPPAPPSPIPTPQSPFDGERTLDLIAAQLDLGPRHPGTPGHLAVQRLIADELAAQGWAVERQAFEYRGVTLTNLIGRYPSNIGGGPIVLVAAHYDTRARADADLPELHDQPVPGAIDGGSGVAVLLELARVLDVAATGKEVWLVFFDGEDNGSGGLPGWEWIVGSRYMAENLTVEPEALVLIDLVGQVEQQFYYEGNSDPALQEEIWTLAAALGFGDDFIPRLKYTMIDDHVPFVERGITAIDIIDFDYPWWHTTHDTLDKASAESLYRIGRLLQVWLEGGVDN